MMQEEEDREAFVKEHEEASEREKRGPSPKADKSKAPRHEGPNPRVYLQIEIRGKLNAKLQASGRLEFELFMDSVPKTAENFRALCTGEKGRDLSFANCMFHKIDHSMATGGDIVVGDGSGGKSIYGGNFEDEGFSKRHDSRGVLSMANTGPNTNNSQFQLMFERASHLEKKHVVFGKMTKDGEDILKSVEQVGSRSGVPKSMVSIVECGQIGGKHITAERRSRSRSPDLSKRVKYSSDGLIDYKSSKRSKPEDSGRQYSSMSDIKHRR